MRSAIRFSIHKLFCIERTTFYCYAAFVWPFYKTYFVYCLQFGYHGNGIANEIFKRDFTLGFLNPNDLHKTDARNKLFFVKFLRLKKNLFNAYVKYWLTLFKIELD